MSTELSLKNEEAQFSVLKKASQDIADECNKLNATDANSATILRGYLAEAKYKLTLLENLRKKLKQPYWDAGVAIDKQLAQPLKDPLEKALAIGESKILVFEKAEQKKKQDEVDRISRIRQKIIDHSNFAIDAMNACDTMEKLEFICKKWITEFPDDTVWMEFLEEAKTMRANLKLYSDQCKIKIESPEQTDDDLQQQIQDAILEESNDVAEDAINSIDTSTAKGIKGTWKFEVFNEQLIPREWLMLDESKVKAFLKIHGHQLVDGRISNGLKFYVEQKITFR